jgi:hypothetical protein
MCSADGGSSENGPECGQGPARAPDEVVRRTRGERRDLRATRTERGRPRCAGVQLRRGSPFAPGGPPNTGAKQCRPREGFNPLHRSSKAERLNSKSG